MFAMASTSRIEEYHKCVNRREFVECSNADLVAALKSPSLLPQQCATVLARKSSANVEMSRNRQVKDTRTRLSKNITNGTRANIGQTHQRISIMSPSCHHHITLL